MKYPLLAIATLLWIASCQTSTSTPQNAEKVSPEIEEFPVNSSIRAIFALDEETLWYAGNRGQYGYTEDGGKSWFRDSMDIAGKPLEFRAIAHTGTAVFLMSVSSPAIVFMSTDRGKTWEEVYREEHPDCYYNSMRFWDRTRRTGRWRSC